MIKALPDLLQRFATSRANDVAVVTEQDNFVSAAELDTAAWRGMEQLREMGAGPGTVVALHGEPGPNWLAALCACWRLGAIAAPLNHRQTAAERERAARILGCEIHWTPTSRDALAPTQITRGRNINWPLQQAMLRVCTSGSTGTPRSVELSLEQLWFNTLGSNLRLGHRKDDRWLVCLPVNHVGALAAIFRCLHNRIAVEFQPVFNAQAVAARLDSGNVSLVSLVPAMLDSVLHHHGEHAFAPQLRAILLGGAACSERLLQRCRAGALPVALSWGMTETASQVATRCPGDLAPLSEGLPPLPYVRVITDAEGRLVVRGSAAQGTLVSDDFGEITASGRVCVLGRRDTIINRGGENIHPAEIEAVLEAHPLVSEAVVLAYDEQRLGQVPVAFVRSDNADPNALRNWCKTHLSGFKVPHRISVLTKLPRTGPGKVDRASLLAQLAAE